MINKYVDFVEGKEIEWLELNLLLSGKPLSKSKIKSISDVDDESRVDLWISELEVRSNLYQNDLYNIDNNIISPLRNWEDVPEYFLCVYYSFFGASDSGNGTKIFELISAHALRNFIDGDVDVFGFPAGENLNIFLDKIAEKCLEERGVQANSDYKDDGVDAIAYKLFNDGRSGNFYVLLQCAAGIHWSKKKPINVGRWTNYIRWFNTNLVCSISTVDFVNQRAWSKRVSDFGIILDRLRIFNFLYKRPIELNLRTLTTQWCQDKIASL